MIDCSRSSKAIAAYIHIILNLWEKNRTYPIYILSMSLHSYKAAIWWNFESYLNVYMHFYICMIESIYFTIYTLISLWLCKIWTKQNFAHDLSEMILSAIIWLQKSVWPLRARTMGLRHLNSEKYVEIAAYISWE